jgi:hypothetical protein
MKLDVHTAAKVEEGRAQLELALSYAYDALSRISGEPIPPREALSIEVCLTAEEFAGASEAEAEFASLKERLLTLMKGSPHHHQAENIHTKFIGQVWRRIKIDRAKLPVPEPTKPFVLTDSDQRIMRILEVIDQRHRRT